MDAEHNGMGDGKVATLIAKPYMRTGEAAAKGKEAEELPPWPSFTDPYQAAGNPDSDALTDLVIILGRDAARPGQFAYRIFQYVHIDEGGGGTTASGEQFFSFLFSGRRPKILTVYGRNLLRTCRYIARHRMPWIRVADRDFRPGDGQDADAAIITRITIEDVQEEE